MNPELLEELNAALATVEVRNPLRSLVNPTFTLVGTQDVLELSLTIDTIDASTGNGFLGLEARFSLGAYHVMRRLRDPLRMGQFVHRCIAEFLAHETSESVFVNNQHAVEPTHWGPSANDLEA